MARPAIPCPKCGLKITGNHYWYKGAWKCKSKLEKLEATTKTATIPTTRDGAITYLETLWNKCNREKFENKLRQPHIRLMKNTSRVGSLGHWQSSGRTIAIHPRLFKAGLVKVLEVMLHEMAHQAVSEIDMIKNGGHGSEWRRWMYKIGLPPDRVSQDDITVYMSDKEKAHKEKREEIKKQATAGKEREYYLASGLPVQWFDDQGRAHPGVLVGRMSNTGDRWAFISHSYETTRWTTLPSSMIYKLPADQHTKYNTPEFQRAIETIKASIASRNARKADNRQLRKGFRSLGRYF